MFLALLGFLALGPQVVLSQSFGRFRLGFAQVNQCEPFAVNFRGDGQFNSTPTHLTVLPFDSVPVTIAVPPSTANSTGLNLNFVPFTADTTFIASLDDDRNRSTTLVSDIIQVFSSQDNSCLSPRQSTSPFRIEGGQVSQCEDFTVSYNTTTAPSIRAFIPNGFAFPLKMTSNSNGKATYTMTAFRGVQVLLLFDDDSGTRRTSSLLTVFGTSTSSRQCFPNFGNFGGQMQTSSSPKVSKGVIIGLSVGGGIVILVAIAMVLFVRRERAIRRRRLENRMTFKPTNDTGNFDLQGRNLYEHKRRPSMPLPPLPPMVHHTVTYPEGFVKDPPYVSEKYSPTISDYPRTSISWEVIDSEAGPSPRKSQSTRLSTMDIERLLNIAANQNSSNEVSPLRGIENPATPTSPDHQRPVSPREAVAPQPVHLTATSRDIPPPDVPQNPSFMFFGNDPSYAEMHGFNGTDRIELFESPSTMESGLLPPRSDMRDSSFEARLSHASSTSSLGYPIIRRPVNAVSIGSGLPTTPRSDIHWQDPSRQNSLVGRNEATNSVTFPYATRNRDSGESAIDRTRF